MQQEQIQRMKKQFSTSGDHQGGIRLVLLISTCDWCLHSRQICILCNHLKNMHIMQASRWIQTLWREYDNAKWVFWYREAILKRQKNESLYTKSSTPVYSTLLVLCKLCSDMCSCTWTCFILPNLFSSTTQSWCIQLVRNLSNLSQPLPRLFTQGGSWGRRGVS